MRRLPLRPRALLITALTVGVIGGIVLVGSLVRLAGAHDPDQAQFVVLFIAGDLLVVLCIPVAAWAERALHPRRLGSSAYRSAPAPSPAMVRRKHRQERTAVILGLVLFPGITIGLIVAAFSYYSGAGTSQFTQQHGVRRSAAVVSVQNSPVKGGYVSQMQVRLAPPVNGQVATTVYVKHESVVSEGNRIAVLVDPDRPDYAELPGQPYTTAGDWITCVIVATGGALFTVFYVKSLISMIRRQRAYREMLTPVTAA